VKRFRGGLVCKAHRRLHHSTLGLRVKKKKTYRMTNMRRAVLALCTLHPTPYNLHPTPHTLNPTTYTLHPTPCTLHPTPRSLMTNMRRAVLALCAEHLTSHSHTHSRTHSHTHSRTHSHTHSHTHSRTHSHTHSLTHSHTHSLTLTLTLSPTLSLYRMTNMRRAMLALWAERCASDPSGSCEYGTNKRRGIFLRAFT